MGMENLTKEVLTQRAADMARAEAGVRDAIKIVEDTCEWVKEDFAGQNELAWVQSVEMNKVSLYDFHDLLKRQSDKLNSICELFDPAE